MATAQTATATAFKTGVSHDDDSFKAGKEAANKALAKLGGIAPEFGILFCSSRYNYREVLKGVKETAPGAQVIGCSSASEFTEEEVTKDSVVCAFISSPNFKFFTSVGRGIKKDPAAAVEAAARALPEDVPGFNHRSAIMLIDALSGRGDEVVDAALKSLGPTVRFSGGAAADNLQFKNTYVFHNDHAYLDAAVVAMVASKNPVFIGVKHGHCPISTPLTLTRVKDNIVYSIDGMPAFDVWKTHTRERAKAKGIDVDNLPTPSDVGSFLVQYEAGLLAGHEYKVRAPLSVNADGSINFACSMTEGSVIRIMESPNKYYQIVSAKGAAEIAMKAAKGAKIAGAIVFDCVCRSLILDKEFHKGVDEIKSVIGAGVPVIGFATYGEIAMEMGQLSGFHNTTTVVLLIPE
jgi:hypothetical protein